MPKISDSFNARGQTVVGFETLSVGDRAIGVGVNGTDCGVHGEGARTPLGTRVVPTGTGVHGRGDTTGVVGETEAERGAGVLGIGSERGVTGILGASMDQRSEREKKRVPDFGSGVVGATNQELGYGVVGLSVASFNNHENIAEIPVSGRQTADGPGTGVKGASGKGTGVYGISGDGHGGVFESGVGAQVNLRPLFETANPPGAGLTGDLLVITRAREGETSDFAELWFCLRGNTKIEKTAIWGRVQFQDTFQAPSD